MAVNDIFRVAAVGLLNEQLIVNVFHYRQSTANTSTLTDLESLARAFNAGPLAAIANASSQDIGWNTIEVRSFTTPDVPLRGYDLSVAVVGQQEDVAAPPTVCWVVRKRTGFLGRKYRGRNYFAGLGQSDIDEGQLSVAGIIKYQSARDAILAPLTWTAAGSPTFIPSVAAHVPAVLAPDGTVITPAAIRSNDVVSVYLDRVLRSQRRREIGVGQ